MYVYIYIYMVFKDGIYIPHLNCNFSRDNWDNDDEAMDLEVHLSTLVSDKAMI